MTAQIRHSQTNLYDADYLLWIETTVEKLRQRDYAEIDWENVIEQRSAHTQLLKRLMPVFCQNSQQPVQ